MWCGVVVVFFFSAQQKSFVGVFSMTTTTTMSSSAFRECDAEDDDDELLDEEEEEEEEEEKEETRKKLDAVLGKLRKHSERVRKDIRDILSLAKSHADAHAMSTKEHARLHSETTRVYCESVEKAVDSTDDLMQRVVSVAAFAAPLKALATRTRTLRMRAELLEKMCEEKGIITACLLYTSPSPRDATLSRMPSSA